MDNPVERMSYLNTHFILCSYSFVPYPHSEKNPKFALGGDVYAWIPNDLAKKYGDHNHALAIWQDRETKEWIVRKEFKEFSHVIMNFGDQKGLMLRSSDTGKFQEVYRGDNFQEALDQCTILGHKYHGSETEWKACDHGEYQRHCLKRLRGKKR